jgi:hypothetical protein
MQRRSGRGRDLEGHLDACNRYVTGLYKLFNATFRIGVWRYMGRRSALAPKYVYQLGSNSAAISPNYFHPNLYLILVCELATSPRWWPVVGSALAGAAGPGCLTLAIYRGCIGLPSHKHPDCDWTQTTTNDFGLTAKEVFRQIVVLTLAWALLGPVALAR